MRSNSLGNTFSPGEKDYSMELIENRHWELHGDCLKYKLNTKEKNREFEDFKKTILTR